MLNCCGLLFYSFLFIEQILIKTQFKKSLSTIWTVSSSWYRLTMSLRLWSLLNLFIKWKRSLAIPLDLSFYFFLNLWYIGRKKLFCGIVNVLSVCVAFLILIGIFHYLFISLGMKVSLLYYTKRITKHNVIFWM